MSLNSPLPFFPVPPEDYDQRYFNEIIRSFSTFLGQYSAAQESSEEDRSNAVGWFLG